MRLFSTLILLSVLLLSCQSSSNTDNSKAEKKVEKPTKKKEITLKPFSESPDFTNAKLSLKTPKKGSKLKNGEINFDFGVENYTLGNQTEDADGKMCANSKKGQHIHLILNNEPYSALYTPEFKKDLKDNYYVALAFLSRSYHESIKTKDAYQLWDFRVGETPPIEADLTAPQLFYSRPKGKYIGKDTEKIMLDFYITNCELSREDYKVKATINEKSFLLTEWKPYFIEGLPMGENKITLELLDKDNKQVQSILNPITRTIQLYEDEPLVN